MAPALLIALSLVADLDVAAAPSQCNAVETELQENVSDADDATSVDDGRLHFAVRHQFSLAEARDRMGFLLSYWADRFGLESRWLGRCVKISGAIFGVHIDGWLRITEAAIVGEAADPGWLWRSRSQAYVLGKIRKYLHPHYEEP